MMRAAAAVAILLLALAAVGLAREPAGVSLVVVADLPPEARQTLARIKRGGPFPHAKDGSVFGNRERLLPLKERGYYREYTVSTPGARDRAARRIVAGGCGTAPRPAAARSRTGSEPYFVAPCVGGEYYYTDDHYTSFRRIRE